MPRRITWFVLVLLAACMSASAPAARADPAGEMPAGPSEAAPSTQTPEPRSASACSDFVNGERRLEHELSVQAQGPRGLPTLCLLYYPTDDVYRGVFLRVDSTAQFRAAKEAAVRQLTGQGLDVCQIGRWDFYGRSTPDDRTPASDFLELPVECRPRVTAADDGAMQRLDDIRATVERARAMVVEQMNWRQNRPLMVIVVTDVLVAVPLYRRFAPQAQQHAEQMAVAGRSEHVGGSAFGSLIILNLIRERSAESTEEALIHELTHVVQHGIGGSSSFFPRWFLEGQAVYQEIRNSRSSTDIRHTNFALTALADGTALRLAEVSLSQDWNARESSSDGVTANYSRAYVTMAYLSERHGFEATVALLQGNRNGSLANFNSLLTGLTGLDLDALDRAVSDWLMNAVRVSATDMGGGLRLNVALIPGRFHLRAVVTIERRLPCGSIALGAGATYTVMARVAPGGEFTGRSTFSNTDGVAMLDGNLATPGELHASFRYQRPSAGCDSGPYTFTAPIAA